MKKNRPNFIRLLSLLLMFFIGSTTYGQIRLSLRYSIADSRYHVYLTPTNGVNSVPNSYLTDGSSQVTLMASTTANLTIGTVTSVNPVGSWSLSTVARNNGDTNSGAPANTDFFIITPSGDFNNISYTNGVEVELFNFDLGGTCGESLDILPSAGQTAAGETLNIGSYYSVKGYAGGIGANHFVSTYDMITACTICPTIANTAGNNTNPNSCGSGTGSIKVCGLTANASGYTVNYDKNSLAATALTNQTADATGCITITSLTAGSYTNIKISSAACPAGSNGLSATLTDPSAPSAPAGLAGVPPSGICVGTSVGLSATVTSGATYTWTLSPSGATLTSVAGTVSGTTASNTLTSTLAGTYTASLTQTVSGCISAPATTTITVNATPSTVAPTAMSKSNVCPATTVDLTTLQPGAVLGVTYEWHTVGSNPTVGTLVASATAAASGTYYLYSKSASGCYSAASSAVTATVTISKPSLTIQNVICSGNGSGYTVSFSSNATVTTNNGTVSGNTVTVLSGNATLTSTTSCGGLTSLVVTVPTCPVPATCTQVASLSVGNAECTGTGTYTVSFSASNGTVTSSAGTLSGNTVINIPVGVNAILTITSTSPACTGQSITVTSPTSCATPSCTDGSVGISFSTSCNSNSTFNINYTASISGTTVTSSANSFANLTGAVTLTVTKPGCSPQNVVVTAPVCVACSKPVLTVQNVICSGNGSGYTVSFSSNATVTTNNGTVIGNTVTVLSGNATLTSTTSCGEVTSMVITAPSCPVPATCTQVASLSVGNAICTGTGTYKVSFSATNGTVMSSAGTISGNTVVNIPVGVNAVLSITPTSTVCNGQSITVTSPTSCITPSCTDGSVGISFSTSCNSNGTYNINYTASISGTTVTSSGNSFANLTGAVTLTVTKPGCSPQSVVISALVCLVCSPDLTTTLVQPSPSPTAGQSSNIPVTVSNIGNCPTTGPITMVVQIPVGTTFGTFPTNNNGWTCTTNGTTATCTYAGPIANGTSSTFNVVFIPTIAQIGTSLIIPAAVVSGGGEPSLNIGNNTSSPITTPPCGGGIITLAISKSAPSTAIIGSNFTYNLTVQNTGTMATNGTVIIVQDNLPNGIAFLTGNGVGWSCGATGQLVTCSSIGIIGVGGSNTITLTVTPTTSGNFNNTASVLGGGNQSGIKYSNTVTTVIGSSCGLVSAKAFLQGPFDSNTGLMSDALRAQSLIPLKQPYNSFPDFNYTGSESVAQSVLNVTGSNAIVDWVMLELRSSSNPSTVVSRNAALIQRDGDIVDTDGVSPVCFNGLIGGNYHVAVRHRNHLGVMNSAPVTISGNPVLVNFTTSATGNYNVASPYAQHTVTTGASAGVRVMWSGNSSGDNNVIFQGPGSDIDYVFDAVHNAPGNVTIGNCNFIRSGYLRTDFNLDGNTIYQGPDSDTDIVFFNVLYYYLGNTGKLPNAIIAQQIP